MTKLDSKNLHDGLTAIHSLIQQNQIENALTRLSPMLLKWPENADVVHLAALAHKANNNYEQSIGYFNESLKINKLQPQVHNNLANLYLANKQYGEAEKHYLSAVALQSNYFDAMRNLALCHSAQHQYSLAEKEFINLLKLKPNDVSVLTSLADCYRQMEVLYKAQETYNKALALAPNHLVAWHNLGLNYHLQGQLDEALRCYKKAYSIAPDTVEVVQSFASTMHETGSTSQAIDIFERALNNNPSSVLLHERLNEMLWEQGLKEQFCLSYRRAIAHEQNSLSIRQSYVSLLFRTAQTDLATAELDLALEHFKGDFELLSLKGQIEAEKGDYRDACRSLSESLKVQFSKDAAHALTKIFVIEAQYTQAQEVLTQLIDRFPDCQLTWALQSLVWRLTNDERYSWLNNYDQFVRTYKIEAPDGYADLDQFLHSLEVFLLSMHHTEEAPLKQTLRHGTQAAARLLSMPAPEIVALKQCLEKIVASYIKELPNDKDHPFLSRKSNDFEFSGSWSVKLRSTGFHVNHVHPEGWISSSVYISIPLSMVENEDERMGAIKFGESPLELGAREVVEKTIKPQPGTVVLFPSYMWHGTFPYVGAKNDFRLTSPFDVLPKNLK